MQKKSWALCKVRCTETTSLVRFLWKGRHYNSRAGKAILQCQSLVVRVLQHWDPGRAHSTKVRPSQVVEQWLLSCHFEKCNNTKVHQYPLQELSTVLQRLLRLENLTYLQAVKNSVSHHVELLPCTPWEYLG